MTAELADRWGDRPLTFLSPAHIRRAAQIPDGIVIAEPCGCGGSWITYRAVHPCDAPAWSVVVIQHGEAVLLAPQMRHAVPETVRDLARQRAQSV